MNDLEAAAEHAVLTGQVRSLVAWLGSGRKLTQTGRIGLADARHLERTKVFRHGWYRPGREESCC